MSHVVMFLMLPVFMFGKEEKKKKMQYPVEWPNVKSYVS